MQRKGAVSREAMGRMRPEIRTIVGEAPRPDLLLEHLLAARKALGSLDEAALACLAEALRISEAEVYEVATFFPAVGFGEGTEDGGVKMCGDLPCALRRPRHLQQALETGWLDGAPCHRGACRGLCDGGDGATRPVARSFEQYRRAGGYETIQRLHLGKAVAERLIEQLASWPRGGARIAQKWREAAAAGEEPVVIVNADEGDPGSLKDRHILASDPHGVLEGALATAAATGAARIIVALRDAYEDLRPVLLEAMGAVNNAFPSLALRWELRGGGGAYICGEETALIASLEGRRGMPREQPPAPSRSGLFGAPTLVHNVETLYRLRAAWGAAPEPAFPLSRLLDSAAEIFTLSGEARDPGVKIVSSFTSLRKLVEQCGGMAEGRTLAGMVVGGSLGRIAIGRWLEAPRSELQAAGFFLGSVIVFSEEHDIDEIAARLAAFHARESCGQCVPCRVGTAKAADLLTKGKPDEGLLTDLAAVMAEASICGLGKGAGRFLQNYLQVRKEIAQ